MPLARFDLPAGSERNPALTESGCEPREAESLRVSRGGASVNLGVTLGPAESVVQTESAATWWIERNVVWMAELRRSPSATISCRAVNKKATGFRGGGKTSPNATASNLGNGRRTGHEG